MTIPHKVKSFRACDSNLKRILPIYTETFNYCLSFILAWKLALSIRLATMMMMVIMSMFSLQISILVAIFVAIWINFSELHTDNLYDNVMAIIYVWSIYHYMYPQDFLEMTSVVCSRFNPLENYFTVSLVHYHLTTIMSNDETFLHEFPSILKRIKKLCRNVCFIQHTQR